MDYFEKYGKSLAEGRDLNPRTPHDVNGFQDLFLG